LSLPPLYFLILSEQNEVSTFRTLNLKMTLRNLNYRIMINRFVLNEVSYFGPGAREVLPQEIKRLGLKKAFVSTDKDLIKFGVADKVLSVLDKAGIPYVVFSDIKPNPTVSNVNAGVKAFAESGADFILAIGGGSSIDTSKAIGIITNNPEFSDVVSLEGVAPTKKKSVPIIALPTTAGTAAEVTINYVITDEVNEKKMVCVDPNDIPAIAIVDAELMYTLPKGLTASTGLDALTHAIEGLITKGAWEMSDMFEIKAIEMITRYLETAVFEPTNAEARNGMAVAQYIAGMAFSNVGLGVVHGMAHPLGAIFDIPHGVANALLLPIIMEFNAPAALDKYVEIAKAMTVYKEGMSQEEAARAAVDAVRALSVRVGIPQHLSELGIKESDLDKLATAAIVDVCTPGNPREVTKEIILDLYKKAL
jgi:lactaldehyde reductase